MSNVNNLKLNTRNGIVICGSYGQGNAGDESILKAILQEIRQAAPEESITVLSRNPEETTARHGVHSLHMFDIAGFKKVMRHAKLYINGGGSLIQDITSRRSLWYYLFTLRIAKKCGCKVLMYGCGIGPVNHPQDISFTRKILNKYVDAITLREDSSLRELERFGVTKPEIILASDPALTLLRASDTEIDTFMQRSGLDPKGNYLGLCVRNWSGFENKAAIFADVIQYAKKTYDLTPVFLSINYRSDGATADQVISLLDASIPKESIYVSRQPLSTEETLGLMSRMQAVISMRLHGLIFAAGQGIPLVGVVYDPKVNAFLDYINQPLYEDLNEITSESLRKNLDCALALRDDRAALEKAVSRLRKIEQNNTDTLLKLLQNS